MHSPIQKAMQMNETYCSYASSTEKSLNGVAYKTLCAGDVESSVRAFLAGHGDGGRRTPTFPPRWKLL